MGGTKRLPTAQELLLLCTGCHLKVESDRTWALEIGALLDDAETREHSLEGFPLDPPRLRMIPWPHSG
jgi:hypothetical protein